MTNPLDLPEAPASLTFKGVTQRGWDVQFTLRDWSEEALLARFKAFAKTLEEANVTPRGQQAALPAAVEQPSLGSALPSELPGFTGSPSPQKAEELSFEAEELVPSMDKGRRFFKIKGGRFMQYGVRIWPEVLAEAGIDSEKIDMGVPSYPLKGLTAHYIEKDGKPDKVTRLVRS